MSEAEFQLPDFVKTERANRTETQETDDTEEKRTTDQEELTSLEEEFECSSSDDEDRLQIVEFPCDEIEGTCSRSRPYVRGQKAVVTEGHGKSVHDFDSPVGNKTLGETFSLPTPPEDLPPGEIFHSKSSLRKDGCDYDEKGSQQRADDSPSPKREASSCEKSMRHDTPASPIGQKIIPDHKDKRLHSSKPLVSPAVTTTASSNNCSRRNSKIPVGIAVAWQRLVTTCATSTTSTNVTTAAISKSSFKVSASNKPIVELKSQKLPSRPSSASPVNVNRCTSVGTRCSSKMSSPNNPARNLSLDGNSKCLTPELGSSAKGSNGSVVSRPLPSSSVPPNMGLPYYPHSAIIDYQYGVRSLGPFPHHYPGNTWRHTAAEISYPHTGFGSHGGAYLQQTIHNQIQLHQQLTNYPPVFYPGFDPFRHQFESMVLQSQQEQQQLSELCRQYPPHHQQLLLEGSSRAPPTTMPPLSPRISIPLPSPSPTGGVRAPTPTSFLNPSTQSLSLSNLPSAATWSAPPTDFYPHNSSAALSPKSLTSSSPSPVTVQNECNYKVKTFTQPPPSGTHQLHCGTKAVSRDNVGGSSRSNKERSSSSNKQVAAAATLAGDDNCQRQSPVPPALTSSSKGRQSKGRDPNGVLKDGVTDISCAEKLMSPCASPNFLGHHDFKRMESLIQRWDERDRSPGDETPAGSINNNKVPKAELERQFGPNLVKVKAERVGGSFGSCGGEVGQHKVNSSSEDSTAGPISLVKKTAGVTDKGSVQQGRKVDGKTSVEEKKGETIRRPTDKHVHVSQNDPKALEINISKPKQSVKTNNKCKKQVFCCSDDDGDLRKSSLENSSRNSVPDSNLPVDSVNVNDCTTTLGLSSDSDTSANGDYGHRKHGSVKGARPKKAPKYEIEGTHRNRSCSRGSETLTTIPSKPCATHVAKPSRCKSEISRHGSGRKTSASKAIANNKDKVSVSGVVAKNLSKIAPTMNSAEDASTVTYGSQETKGSLNSGRALPLSAILPPKASLMSTESNSTSTNIVESNDNQLPYHCSPLPLLLPKVNTVTNSSVKLVVSSQEIKIPAFPTTPSSKSSHTISVQEATTQIRTVEIRESQSPFSQTLINSSSLNAAGSLHVNFCDSSSRSSDSLGISISDSSPKSQHKNIQSPLPQRIFKMNSETKLQKSMSQQGYIGQEEENHLNLLATVAQEFGAREDLGKLTACRSKSTSEIENGQMLSPFSQVSSPENSLTYSNSPYSNSISLPSSPQQLSVMSQVQNSTDTSNTEKEQEALALLSTMSQKNPVWLKIPHVVPHVTEKPSKLRKGSSIQKRSTTKAHDAKKSKKLKLKPRSGRSRSTELVNGNVKKDKTSKHKKNPKMKSSAITSVEEAAQLKIPKIPTSDEKTGALKLKLSVPKVAKLRIKLSDTDAPSLVHRGKAKSPKSKRRHSEDGKRSLRKKHNNHGSLDKLRRKTKENITEVVSTSHHNKHKIDSEKTTSDVSKSQNRKVLETKKGSFFPDSTPDYFPHADELSKQHSSPLDKNSFASNTSSEALDKSDSTRNGKSACPYVFQADVEDKIASLPDVSSRKTVSSFKKLSSTATLSDKDDFEVDDVKKSSKADFKLDIKSIVPYTPKRLKPLSQRPHIKPCLKPEPVVRPHNSSDEENSETEIDLEVASLTKSVKRPVENFTFKINENLGESCKPQKEKRVVQPSVPVKPPKSVGKNRRFSSASTTKQKRAGRRLSLNLETGRTSQHDMDVEDEEDELLDICDPSDYSSLSTSDKKQQSSPPATSNKVSHGNKTIPRKRSSRSLTGSSLSGAPTSSTMTSHGSDGSSSEKPTTIDETTIPGKIELDSVSELRDEMRILTEIQGLFYTGKLNALQPPDVYGVTLDNERGASPHLIFSAEEVLEKCIREKKPQSLTVGLRICAYWSPQYSGLYTGRVSTDFNPNFDPEKDLIPIEFDDGDTGMIKLGEIRMLPKNHPIREYDPNPLLTLEKKHRKRRHWSSTTSSGPCTGDHEEPDCGESYCAKVAKLQEEEDEDDLKDSHKSYKSLYWTWTGLGYKRPKSKKNRNKEFFRGIQRGDEVINIGDSAVFISHGNERPYIGRIEKFWEKKGQKVVTVRWFYHPEEVKSPKRIPHLKHPGALFESPHIDENDVQTIAKKCDVLPFAEFKERVGRMPRMSLKNSKSTKPRNMYYVAGYYDPYNYNLQLKI